MRLCTPSLGGFRLFDKTLVLAYNHQVVKSITIYGHDTFKSEQEEAAVNFLTGRDVHNIDVANGEEISNISGKSDGKEVTREVKTLCCVN